MTDRPARKSPRLKGYDYASDGAYFVTICTQNQVRLFGDVVDGTMRLNPAGVMVADWWQALPDKFPDLALDQFVVMPNHVHGILILVGRSGTQARPYTLSEIIGWFKTMTTNQYIREVHQSGWETFAGKLWQRSFHDHIIRNQPDLDRLRQYTLTNPGRWEEDSLFTRS